MDAAALTPYARQVLDEATLPELPNHYRGKVRDNYDLPDGRRILITSDRISAFDRALAAIPFKGQVLTQTPASGSSVPATSARTMCSPTPIRMSSSGSGCRSSGRDRGARLPRRHDLDLDPDSLQGRASGKCTGTACQTA